MNRLHWSFLFFLTSVIGCNESKPSEEAIPDVSMSQTGDGGPEVILERPEAVFVPELDTPTTPLGLIPFPNALYLDDTGQLDLRGFPNQNQGSIIARTVTALQEHTDGFGTTATMYLGLNGPVATNSLPKDSSESLREESSLFLVNVEEGSSAYGERLPINWRQQETENLYLPAHTLKVRLVEGVSLRSHQHYALCLTTSGAKPAAAFVELLANTRPEGPLAVAWDRYAPLRNWANERPQELASCALFKTQDPVGELFAARDFVYTLPAPEVRDLESLGGRVGLFELLVGKYTAPRFQQGELPYLTPGTGGFRFDEAGQLIVQGYEDLRFALTIPLESEMPEDGWPVVLYGHGTGGDYQSFLNAKVAVTLARAGIAVLSIDQIHHGFRDPRPDGCRTQADPSACVSLVFFNFLIPEAGRDNVRQSALDSVSLLRLAKGFNEELPVRGTERPEDRPDRIETDAGSAPAEVVDAGLIMDTDMMPPADGLDAGVGLDGEVMPPPSDAFHPDHQGDAADHVEPDLGAPGQVDSGLADASQEAVSDADVGPSMDAGTEVEVDSGSMMPPSPSPSPSLTQSPDAANHQTRSQSNRVHGA